MVEIVNNLLKLTDYPFAYSFVTLLLSMSGHPIDLTDITRYIPIFLIMGLIGTALSIIDPLGNAIRLLARYVSTSYLFKNSRGTLDVFSFLVSEFRDKTEGQFDYNPIVRVNTASNLLIKVSKWFKRVGATSGFVKKIKILQIKCISTTWISYEIDKIVSTIYFLIILIALMILFFNTDYSEDFCKRVIISANITEGTQICRPNTTTQTISAVTTVTMLAVAGITIWRVTSLFRYLWVLATYFFIVDEYPKLQSFLNKLFDPEIRTSPPELDRQAVQLLEYINRKDWAMADFFANVIWDKIHEYVKLALKSKLFRDEFM